MAEQHTGACAPWTEARLRASSRKPAAAATWLAAPTAARQLLLPGLKMAPDLRHPALVPARPRVGAGPPLSGAVLGRPLLGTGQVCPCCAGAAAATGPPAAAEVPGWEEKATAVAGCVAIAAETAGSAVGVLRPIAMEEEARRLPLQGPAPLEAGEASSAGVHGSQGVPHCPPLAAQIGAQSHSGVHRAVLLVAARSEHVEAAAFGAHHAAAAR